jgi:hypothetical protein
MFNRKKNRIKDLEAKYKASARKADELRMSERIKGVEILRLKDDLAPRFGRPMFDITITPLATGKWAWRVVGLTRTEHRSGHVSFPAKRVADGEADTAYKAEMAARKWIAKDQTPESRPMGSAVEIRV